MTKEDSRRKAHGYLQKARQRLREISLPKRPHRETDLIAAIRKTREDLWEAKLAARL